MFKQTSAVVVMNLRSLPLRISNSLVIVIGIAGVVAVLVSMLAMADGLLSGADHAAQPDHAIVLRGGSENEISSYLGRDAAVTILDAPGVKRDEQGQALGSPETVMVLDQPLRDGSDGNLTLRGIGKQALVVQPDLHLTAGRWFQPGLRELVVGNAAQQQFGGLKLGDHVTTLGGAEWTVVGVFNSGGDMRESQALGDAETVLSAYGRDGFQSITVVLDTPQSFATFKDALTSNPQLSVEVMTQKEYLESLSKDLNKAMHNVAIAVGVVMAVGALFGALNTMFSAVSTRTVEIATLRAIGFRAGPVVASVLTEALVLSLLGGVVGATGAWLAFNGHQTNTLGGNFSQMAFKLTVTPTLIGEGIAVACLIGFLGGLLPAIKAARMPVAAALRAL